MPISFSVAGLRVRSVRLVALCCLGISASVSASIDPDAAKQHFAQAAELSERDAGRLWGRSLGGPMLFVDPATREVVANQPDEQGALQEQGGLWIGKLPEAIGIANHAVQWSGTRWTMLMWPLPNTGFTRGRLLMHESFHRVQDDLGLPAGNPANSHVDTMAGRLFLRLEWRALAEAVLAEGAKRRSAAADALTFRAARLASFPSDAGEQERALHLNEGLAEYTGWRLCGLSREAAASRIALVLEQNEWGGPFARNFAYTSGPAWGWLLDELRPDWRTGVSIRQDLPDLLAEAIGWQRPADPVAAARDRFGGYRGGPLEQSERGREQKRLGRLEKWKARFFSGPVLVLAAGPDVNYSYNPNAVEGYDESSSVYSSIKMRDQWGTLEAEGDVLLIRRDGRIAEIRVPAPTDLANPIGEGWRITLESGWKLKAGERAGDAIATKE